MNNDVKKQILEKIKEIGVPINDFYQPEYGKFDFNAGKEHANTYFSVFSSGNNSYIVFTDENGITRVIPESLLFLELIEKVGFKNIYWRTSKKEKEKFYFENIAKVIGIGYYDKNTIFNHLISISIACKNHTDFSLKDDELLKTFKVVLDETIARENHTFVPDEETLREEALRRLH